MCTLKLFLVVVIVPRLSIDSYSPAPLSQRVSLKKA